MTTEASGLSARRKVAWTVLLAGAAATAGAASAQVAPAPVPVYPRPPVDEVIARPPEPVTSAPVAASAPPAEKRNAPRANDRNADPYPRLIGIDAQADPIPQTITTLSQAIQTAYLTNPQLLAQRATLRSADFRYPAARSLYGPTLDASGSYTFARDRIDDPTLGVTTERGFNSAASLILNQPIITFGRNSAAQSTAESQIAYGRDTLRIVEAQVLLNVITAYVSVLRDASAVAIAEQNLALLEREYTDGTSRFAAREITAPDLQQIEARFNSARGQRVTAKGQLAVSQARFLQFVGAPPGQLQPPTALAIPAIDLPAAYEIADRESAIIRAAQSREKISRSAVQAAKADFLPRVDWRSSADYGSVSPYNDNNRASRVRSQAVLSVPLFDSGRRQAQLDEAQEANNADWRLIEQAGRETRSAVAEAWNALAAARTSLTFYAQAVQSSTNAYEGARLQERAGLRTTLDVLDLARDLLTVQTNYNIALANEYIARAQLLSAVGRLEGPLLTDVSAYDPTAHFNKVAHNGDIPLITPLLSGIDHAVLPPVAGDRPNLDPAARVATGAALSLPPDASDVAAPLPTQKSAGQP